MSGLPELPYGDGITKRQNLSFGGYNHNQYAGEGELWDMRNMSSDYYPLLAPRRRRVRIGKLDKPNGIFASGRLYWVDGCKLYADGEVVGQLEDSPKRFAALGDMLVILPDKAYYDALTGKFGSLEASWEGSAKIGNGTIFGEAAEANTIRAEGVNFEEIFDAGDAVSISGCTAHPENNVTIIIREVDGEELRFYENSFVTGEGGDDETALTIRREMPEMDHIFTNANRLWGCKGDTIYASKLGDAKNWNVFDGLATDSWTVKTGGAGEFTAATAYKGYPVFFKEDGIYEVYGDRPSRYEVVADASTGVRSGSGESLAIAGEVLFFHSRGGIAAYSGGTPANIAEPFGNVKYSDAVAGSDGVKYFVSMKDPDGRANLFVFDTLRNLWHREDERAAVGFAYHEGLLMLDSEGYIWTISPTGKPPEDAEIEEPVKSMAEFGDFTDSDPNAKGTGKLQLRIDLEPESLVTVYVRFNSGQWEKVKTLTGDGKRSYYLPMIPRRADHMRIKIEGVGEWRLHSLVRESYSGGELNTNMR